MELNLGALSVSTYSVDFFFCLFQPEMFMKSRFALWPVCFCEGVSKLSPAKVQSGQYVPF